MNDEVSWRLNEIRRLEDRLLELLKENEALKAEAEKEREMSNTEGKEGK